MKNWVLGAISGGLAGLAGAWLVSEYDFNLFFVILIGAAIGFVIGALAKIIKKRK